MPTLISGKQLSWLAPINVYATDPTRHAKSWDRYFAMCQPMQNRDFDHDHAVRARLMGLRHLPAMDAARAAAAMTPPLPARTYQRRGAPALG